MLLVLYSVFFFFKQKTAYDMRISDWSSDVCSSDLSAPFFCSDDNNAVSSTRSVKRRCCTAFQDAQGLDVFGVDIGKAVTHVSAGVPIVIVVRSVRKSVV